MENTLKEICNKIEEFVNKHGVLNEYNADDFTKYASSNHKYPLIWNAPTQVKFENGQISYELQLTFAEKMYEKSDLIKVISDTAITVGELMTYLDDRSENCNYYMESNTNFKPFFRNSKVDRTAGWQGTVTIKTGWQSNINNIRFK